MPWILKERAKAHSPELKLTPREQATLWEIGRGLTNRQIADRLGIAESTARDYTNNLLGTLGVRNRTQLVCSAIERGLLRVQGPKSEP